MKKVTEKSVESKVSHIGYIDNSKFKFTLLWNFCPWAYLVINLFPTVWIAKTLFSFLKLLGKLFKLLLNIHINVYHLYLHSKIGGSWANPGAFCNFQRKFFLFYFRSRKTNFVG